MGYGQSVTSLDLQLSAAAKGAFIFCWTWTAWTAFQHMRRSRNPKKSLFIWMIWALLICTALKSIVGFLCVRSILDPNGWSAAILTCITWALEIQLGTQIILNRLGIILPHSRTVSRLKIIYLTVLLLINISVFTIWLQAVKGIGIYIRINRVWDPVQVIIVLLMDAALNVYFVISVKRVLLSFGLAKYKLLIKANVLIIVANMTTDVVLCIFFFTITNHWFFEQFQGLTYVLKARIELQMATLILRVASQETHFDLGGGLSQALPPDDTGAVVSNKPSDSTVTEKGAP